MSILIMIVVGALGTIVVLLLVSAILMWLWNTTIPDVFELKPVTFWQALKLLLIATILFGGPTSAAHVTSEGGPAVIDRVGSEN